MASIAFLMTTAPDDIDNYDSIYCAEVDRFFYVRAEVMRYDYEVAAHKVAGLKQGEQMLSAIELKR